MPSHGTHNYMQSTHAFLGPTVHPAEHTHARHARPARPRGPATSPGPAHLHAEGGAKEAHSGHGKPPLLAPQQLEHLCACTDGDVEAAGRGRGEGAGAAGRDRGMQGCAQCRRSAAQATSNRETGPRPPSPPRCSSGCSTLFGRSGRRRKSRAGRPPGPRCWRTARPRRTATRTPAPAQSAAAWGGWAAGVEEHTGVDEVGRILFFSGLGGTSHRGHRCNGCAGLMEVPYRPATLAALNFLASRRAHAATGARTHAGKHTHACTTHQPTHLRNAFLVKQLNKLVLLCRSRGPEEYAGRREECGCRGEAAQRVGARLPLSRQRGSSFVALAIHECVNSVRGAPADWSNVSGSSSIFSISNTCSCSPLSLLSSRACVSGGGRGGTREARSQMVSAVVPAGHVGSTW